MDRELDEILNECRSELEKNRLGNLPRSFRWRIWNFFRSKGKFLGPKMRIKVALLCIDKVTTQEIIESDECFRICIDLSDKFLKCMDKGWKDNNKEYIVNNLSEKMFEKENQEVDKSVYYRMYSNTIVKTVLINSSEFEITRNYDEIEDLDYDSHDESYWAALKYSGSGLWEEKDIEKRREFWNWYINEAVVEAYETFSTDYYKQLNDIYIEKYGYELDEVDIENQKYRDRLLNGGEDEEYIEEIEECECYYKEGEDYILFDNDINKLNDAQKKVYEYIEENYDLNEIKVGIIHECGLVVLYDNGGCGSIEFYDGKVNKLPF